MSPNCSIRQFAHPVLLAAALWLVALPAAGYIVFLKDGEQIVTREAPRIEGQTAHLILQSGTATTLDASEIDLVRTQKENQVNLGSARLIDGKKQTTLAEGATFQEDEKSLGELINERPTGLTLPEPRSRRSAVQQEQIPLTAAGFVDLRQMPRRAYQDAEVITELQGYLQGQGVEGAKIFEGTATDRPFLEIPANSEASVFKVLRDAANALVQAHNQFPGRVAALELLMVTDSQIRAGQFVLTPDLANELLSGKVDGPSFFYRHVQF